MLNSAEGVTFDLSIAPPIMTSSATWPGKAGSSAMAAARLESGPTATSTISPGWSANVWTRYSGADSRCLMARASGNGSTARCTLASRFTARDFDIAVDGGDAQKRELGMKRGEHDGDGVIGAGVAVEDQFAGHGGTFPS